MEEKKYYLTKEGLDKIKKELKNLEQEKIALLDGSGPGSFRFGEIEAEFITFQEDLGNLKKRIAELEGVLENYEPIKAPLKKEQDKIHVGAKVTVDVDGQIDEFSIVGTMEADPSMGKISNESPVGKALLGHRTGDQVVLNSPVKITYKIKSIKYTE